MIDEKQFIKGLLITVITLGLIAAVVTSYVLYRGAQLKVIQTKTAGSAQISGTNDQPLQSIIDKAGKHIVLPPGTPKLVVVKDVDTLRKTEPFFNSAQNGDDLLVYSDKVILYSPGLDKIVEVATIKISAK